MIFEKTNAMQRQAIEYMSGPCLVLAGAGSGKTNVITKKIAYMIQSCDIRPEHIFAITFTNKAAKEMLERVAHFITPKELKKLTICTFHALGLKILKSELHHLGLKEQFSILDGEETLSIIQNIMATTDKALLKKCQTSISHWKNRLLQPPDVLKEIQTKEEEQFASIYQHYVRTLKAYQAVDFDDLVTLPTLLFHSHPEVLQKWQHRIHYVLIDEYQDTSFSQYTLLRLLTQQRELFTAVGDDDQAIYGWRGASVENLHQLSTDYPTLQVIKLEQNYRSAQNILNAANHVIAHNPRVYDKKLWSQLGDGTPIRLVEMENEQDEAEKTAFSIATHKSEQALEWSDFAILYRGNHQARILEQALREMQIPYTITGGQSFFDRMEIRDILAYLRLIVNPDDDSAFIRAVTTPRKGVGDTTLELLSDFSTQQNISFFAAIQDPLFLASLNSRQLASVVRFRDLILEYAEKCSHHVHVDTARPIDLQTSLNGLLEDIQYEHHLYNHFEERTANNKWLAVVDLVNWLSQKSKNQNIGLADIMQQISLLTLLDQQENELSNAIHLTTIHAAKGLEFHSVYMVGVEEGLLPHFGKEDETGDPEKMEDLSMQRIQEERRLMYVGITRAKYQLTISWCKKRKKAREEQVREPSRFITEMGVDTQTQQKSLSPKERIALMKAQLASKTSSPT